MRQVSIIFSCFFLIFNCLQVKSQRKTRKAEQPYSFYFEM
ncbi:hypothetical protein NEIMUCOT_04592 [Neisseria mucosa ATCC 25996]|uniref:Uncharacterized protein n=1 Tax=Neisseria mucosa (strain ATCC 25996 / DSM 4631 / NCTC 10774 / M26) TaxID=546266 RepID=D2ZVF0_NEIM2|nr:hypothetical protein NEIMUCOT_04592 [Neisseria mucosa ATCC 25996]